MDVNSSKVRMLLSSVLTIGWLPGPAQPLSAAAEQHCTGADTADTYQPGHTRYIATKAKLEIQTCYRSKQLEKHCDGMQKKLHDESNLAGDLVGTH